MERSKAEQIMEILFKSVQWSPISSDGTEPEPPDPLYGPLALATHKGVLQIGPFTFRCYQLSDGRRVLDAEDVDIFFAGE